VWLKDGNRDIKTTARRNVQGAENEMLEGSEGRLWEDGVMNSPPRPTGPQMMT